MIVIVTGFILAADHCSDDGYVGKQQVTWNQYCME